MVLRDESRGCCVRWRVGQRFVGLGIWVEEDMGWRRLGLGRHFLELQEEERGQTGQAGGGDKIRVDAHVRWLQYRG